MKQIWQECCLSFKGFVALWRCLCDTSSLRCSTMWSDDESGSAGLVSAHRSDQGRQMRMTDPLTQRLAALLYIVYGYPPASRVQHSVSFLNELTPQCSD
mmetsp:Transcript_71314/g.118521  ORF Transcript_71314/g.118521 Transcript_71314/m.118521 type:complete len:99 (-) Transcript_71314:161-457(-)